MTNDDQPSNDPVHPNYLAGGIGAVVGAVVGYYAFGWLLAQGMYAMVLPGALIGLGCGMLLGGASPWMGIACAVAALVVEIVCQWHFLPFAQDESFGFLLRNIHRLPPMQLVMIVVGVLVAYWCGKGRQTMRR